MTQETKKTTQLKNTVLVRDYLAEYRTELANRRTLLSYVRTALTFVAGGIALIEIYEHPAVSLIGWLLMPAGAFILGNGIITYRKVKRATHKYKHQIEDAEQTAL